MHDKRQSQNSLSPTISRAATAAPAIIFVLVLMLVFTQPVPAQTYKVIHNFTGGPDGGWPSDTLTIDTAGNLFGTTLIGGSGEGNGAVFKLSKQDSAWVLTSSYQFQGAGNPFAGVVFGPDGGLYGTTQGEGDGVNCGMVFKVIPPTQTPPNTMGGWTETVLYSFLGGSDGCGPYLGDLIFDQSGNIYGTTAGGGGPSNAGTVFKLSPSRGGWTESLLYSFNGGSDGANPYSSVVFDQAGNLYGTTGSGGNYGYGTVFELTPSGSGWTKKTLYSFQSRYDGASPYGALIFDGSGNLYGTTAEGGHLNWGGTFYKLTANGGNWTETVLYAFTGGGGPMATLVMDRAGNFYGTTYQDGAYGYGAVFKLTLSDGTWNYTSLYDFTEPFGTDGGLPAGGVVFDTNGNLYGTASRGGTGQGCEFGCGVVWEITP
jgi:uncharacterized repeat protein (TIGR03803 family)